MQPESEIGNIEYKLRLNPSRLDELASQLRYRLKEGNGVAIYLIGVDNNGKPAGLSKSELEESFSLLVEVARRASAVVVSKEEVVIKDKLIYKVLLREKSILPREEVCIVALGNVDAGKSTLIATLTTGELDDGRGRLLPFVSRHPHEIKFGRTSSVSRILLGFASDGTVVNYLLPEDEAEIARHSSKAVRFIDLGGHERYLRTTARGLMASMADYVMYVISYMQALHFQRYPLAREHLGLAIVLNMPFFIVFTKKDLVPSEEIADKAVNNIARIIKKFRYIPVRIKNSQEPIESLAKLTLKRFVPIFEVSNVTGEGREELLRYLNSLPKHRQFERFTNADFLLYIDEIWTPKGRGLVVGGLILRGYVSKGDEVLIGPLEDGSWRLIRIRSIRVHDIDVERAQAGQYATLALDGINRDDVRKGMILASKKFKPINITSFKAKIWVLHHPTTIRIGYQTVAHIHSIRWPVVFKDIVNEKGHQILRTGDIGIVELAFQCKGKKGIIRQRPWYVEPGMRILLRDGRCRAVGIVESISEKEL